MMESAFCFEIAIDVLRLRKKIKCNIPCVSVAFLNFPTIVIHSNKVESNTSKEYSFKNGKSCLFKISPTVLYDRLINTPIYLFVFDQKQSNVALANNQQPCIGTTSLDLSYAIKKVIQGIQNCGLCKASSYGDSVCIPLLNNLQDTIGYIEAAFKLTCLGQTLLSHLSTFQYKEKSKGNFEDVSCKLGANVFSNEDFSINNKVDCPPALYFKSKTGNDMTESKEISETNSLEKASNDQNTVPDALKEERKSTVIETKNQMKNFIHVKPLAGQKSESTQTDLEHLNQYPLLKALISEVVELGLNKPSLSLQQPQQQIYDFSPENPSLPHPKTKVISSHSKFARPLQSLSEKNYIEEKSTELKISRRKKHGLSYGLTKTHILRLSLNKQSPLSATYTKSFHRPKTKQHKKRSSKQLPVKKKSQKSVSAFTQTIHDDTEGGSLSQNILSDNASTELRFGSIKDPEEPSLSPDKSSPRVMSRQSIEIRMPSALTENSFDFDEDITSSYKYSDDFDEEQLSIKSHSLSSSTALSSQTSSSDLSTTKEETQQELSRKLSNVPSSLTTVSDQSQVSAGMEENGLSGENFLDSLATKSDLNTVESSQSHLSNIVPAYYSSEKHLTPSMSDIFSKDDNDSKSKEDSKTTNESLASVLTTLNTSKKLPIPAPSSDSPVIRSLVSEPRSRKPRPPAVSHSSSLEHTRRKFKRSSETSFQFSDPSDVRSSDLVDIRTSELDEFKSTDENISPMHSIDVLASNTSFLNVKK